MNDHDDPPLSTRAASGRDLGAEILPLPDESPGDYLARLKALHARVGALIATIETRRPVLGPMPAGSAPRAVLPDRREGVRGERRTQPDRRVGLPDARPVAADRRQAPVDRREDAYGRRRVPSPVPWQGRLRLDGTVVMWALQVLAWTAVVVVALVWGLGR